MSPDERHGGCCTVGTHAGPYQDFAARSVVPHAGTWLRQNRRAHQRWGPSRRQRRPAAASPAVPKTDDDRLGEKLQAYIDCINGPATNISDSGKRYFDWIDDPKVGPTGKETSVYGLYEIRDTKPCLDGIAKAAELEPDDADLEAAAKAFADAVSTAAPLMNEAYKYYDEDNYKDDKWAKAKELHPKAHGSDRDLRGYQRQAARDRRQPQRCATGARPLAHRSRDGQDLDVAPAQDHGALEEGDGHRRRRGRAGVQARSGGVRAARQRARDRAERDRGVWQGPQGGARLGDDVQLVPVGGRGVQEDRQGGAPSQARQPGLHQG
ncbi:MAG: DUF3829 domain-containing protein [Deltaproteobacteria bacterium]|nr:DUF3829 domain-containing protein [Deltaproteobacteria bacterium]